MFIPSTPVRFRYTTVDDIRNEGITASQLSDSKALGLIEVASRLINSVTDQWFSPVHLSHRIDGTDSTILRLPNQVPIIKVESLSLITGGNKILDSESFESDEFITRFRHVELADSSVVHGVDKKLRTLRLGGQFKHGAGNFRLTGFFGWLENGGEKEVTTTLANPVSSGDTTITLASVEDIQVKDVLLINKEINAIVKSVDSDNDTVTVDEIKQSAATGSDVVTFGRTPFLIERATNLWVIRNRFGLGSNQFEQSSRRGMLKSERTDNYSYTIGDLGIVPDATSTGVIEVDRLLSSFVAPAYIDMI